MTVLCRNISLPLDRDESDLLKRVARKIGVPAQFIRGHRIVRRSIDSRKQRPHFVYSLAIDLDAETEMRLLTRHHGPVEPYRPAEKITVPHVSVAAEGGAGDRPVIVGSGPAGLFAAWRLVQAGAPPLIIERGEDVTERSKTWHSFITGGPFDPESNLLFGEGGAGTYSDGKLYTRVHDPRVSEVLEVLVEAGAPAEILIDARPHIGSNRLPALVRNLRRRLIEGGAEVRFGTRMTDIAVERGTADDARLAAIELEPGGALATETLFLAAGHSARDTYRMLAERGVEMEPKAFQMGVRVEHPQPLIDRLQYGESAGHSRLPPAEYQMVARGARGDVFSFCMCPGGEILPAIEKAGSICVNGASRYKRLGPFANSGFVITVEPSSFPAPGDPLSGLRLQEEVESRAAALAGVPFGVPALRLVDFIADRVSANLPEESSYPFPRTVAPFEEFLPEHVVAALRDSLARIASRQRGFGSPEALVVGPESRSSSPLRILRDAETRESPSVAGLIPMGEGAGYAGGILSAAIDGLRCAEAWIARRAPAR